MISGQKYLDLLRAGDFMEAFKLSEDLARDHPEITENNIIPGDNLLDLLVYLFARTNFDREDFNVIAYIHSIATRVENSRYQKAAIDMYSALLFVSSLDENFRHQLKNLNKNNYSVLIKDQSFNAILDLNNKEKIKQNEEEITSLRLTTNPVLFIKFIKFLSQVEQDPQERYRAWERLLVKTADYKAHCLEEAQKYLNETCISLDGHSLPDANNLSLTPRGKSDYSSIKAKYDAVCELDAILKPDDMNASCLEKFYETLNEHQQALSSHRSPAWVNFVIGASIILTGILPGIMVLGVYACANNRNMLFWKSQGESFVENSLEIKPELAGRQ